MKMRTATFSTSSWLRTVSTRFSLLPTLTEEDNQERKKDGVCTVSSSFCPTLLKPQTQPELGRKEENFN